MSRQLPIEDAVISTIPEISSLAPVARGGQKVVYRAIHADFGEVVLKLFLSTDSDRVRREIEAVRENSFSNVPMILQSGLISHAGNQTTYLVEKFVDGETLRATLSRERQLPVSLVLNLLRDLLSTAVELEKCKLVHRDIKPENLMIDRSGKVWLLDFGIARHLDKPSITATAQAFGPATLGYAAPEQFRNLKNQVDIRADLFSIGVVSYEALTGKHPFGAGTHDRFEVIDRTENVEPVRLSIQGDTQGLLAGFIHQLMAKHVSRRPNTAVQARQWFDTLVLSLHHTLQCGGR